MSYRPKVGDTVRIDKYTGMLHPNTIWVVKEVRPDLSLIAVVGRDNRGLLGYTNEHWIDNTRLIKIKLIGEA